MFIDPDGKDIFIPNVKGNPKGAENTRNKATILTNLQKLSNNKLELVATRGGYNVREVKGSKVNESKTLTEGTSLISGLISAKEKTSVVLGEENRADKSKNGDTVVNFNPDKKGETIANADGTKGRPAEIGLAHELLHADENVKGKGEVDKTPVNVINPDGRGAGLPATTDQDELNVRQRENIIRVEQGVTPRATPEIIK